MRTNSSPVIWSDPPASVGLAAGEVHIWRAFLNCEPSVPSRFESTLSPDERARAGRFIFETDRSRFVMARGILRDLLGGYLLLSPAEIQFCYGNRGKPALDPKTNSSSLQFNLSHSGDVALYAFAGRRRVGIDVERFRPELAGDEIAKRYFSAKEVDELTALPAESRTEGFYLCWTRKEAYIKATGDGLQVPLDSFDVSLSPGQSATLSTRDGIDWGITSFNPTVSPEPRYAAAMVVEGANYTTRFFRLVKENAAWELR